MVPVTELTYMLEGPEPLHGSTRPPRGEPSRKEGTWRGNPCLHSLPGGLQRATDASGGAPVGA